MYLLDIHEHSLLGPDTGREIVRETLTLPLGTPHAAGNKIKELGHHTEKQGSRAERRGRLKMSRFRV